MAKKIEEKNVFFESLRTGLEAAIEHVKGARKLPSHHDAFTSSKGTHCKRDSEPACPAQRLASRLRPISEYLTKAVQSWEQAHGKRGRRQPEALVNSAKESEDTFRCLVVSIFHFPPSIVRSFADRLEPMTQAYYEATNGQMLKKMIPGFSFSIFHSPLSIVIIDGMGMASGSGATGAIQMHLNLG